MRFPHLYGPLPAAAVIAVTPYLPGPDGVFPALFGEVGVTSISTISSGEISADTSTMVATGRMSPKNSACTAPTARHWPMSVTNIRRTDHVGQRRADLCSADLDAPQRIPSLGGDVRSGAGGPGDHDEGPMRTARE